MRGREGEWEEWERGVRESHRERERERERERKGEGDREREMERGERERESEREGVTGERETTCHSQPVGVATSTRLSLRSSHCASCIKTYL